MIKAIILIDFKEDLENPEEIGVKTSSSAAEPEVGWASHEVKTRPRESGRKQGSPSHVHFIPA
jgi:hypothetical protein